MDAFTLHKFQVCKLTGSTVVEASFAFEGEDPKIIKQEFQTERVAFAYLRQEAHRWFYNCLRDYVAHKSHIIKANQNRVQLEYLKAAEAFVSKVKELHVFEAVVRFNKQIDVFTAILPNSNNDSYNSSKSNLQALISFAQRFFSLKLNIQ